MKKKVLSLILAAFMMFTLIPAMEAGVSAFVENVLTSEGGNLNGYYVLNSDVKLDNNIVVESTATVSINLNGHVLQGTGDGVVISNSGNLTIYDTGDNAHCFCVDSNGVWNYIGNSSAVVNYSFDTTDGLKTPDGVIASTAIPATGDVIEVHGGCITGGVSDYYYGAGIKNLGKLVLNGGIVVGNMFKHSYEDGYAGVGGGIYSYKGGITINGAAVCGNAVCGDSGNTKHNYGGGIYSDGPVTMTAGFISFNSVTGDGYDCWGYGGGIYVYSDFTMSGGTISGNTVDAYGGGISAWGKTVITGGSICGNKAYGAAGIYAGNETVVSGAVLFYGNAASYCGGAIYSSKTLTVSGAVFENNTAKWGGAIYNNGVLNITGSNIKGNKGTSGAGAIYTIKTLTINDSVISDNYSGGYGGGIEVWDSTATVVIDSTAITGNESYSYGGGVYAWTNSLTITDSTISNNNAGYSGGGVCVYGNLTLTSSAIEDNCSEGWGAGVYYSSYGYATITGCSIDGNESSKSGGGAYLYSGEVTIKDSSISDNTADGWGGGIYNNADSMTITGCTVSGNEALNGGGGIGNDTYCTVEDTVISVNSAAWYTGIGNWGTVVLSGSVEVKENISEETAGIGNNGTLVSDGALYVTDNTATWCAGIANYGSVTLNGETYITGNTDTNDEGTTGAGYYSYLSDDNVLNVFGGKLVIENNTAKTDGTTSPANLCLRGQSSAISVTLSSGFCIEDGKPIGVTIIVSDAIASGAITTICDKDYSSCFKSDVPGYLVYNLANTVMMSTHVPITLTAASATKMYDGTALTCDEYIVTAGTLLPGDTIVATVSGAITNAGITANKISSCKIMRGDVDVTDEYAIETVDGTLEVTKRHIVLESGSAKKTYDTNPLTNSEVTVSGDGFVDGEGVTYETTAQQTKTGSTKNTIVYEFDEGTDAGNYEVETVEGTLTVKPINLFSNFLKYIVSIFKAFFRYSF